MTFSIPDPTGNAKTIEAWNGVLFDKFERFRATLTQGLSAHGSTAIERHCPPAARRVIDLGAGFGDTVLEIAARLAPDAEVVGVDAAARFVAAGERAARAAGANNCRFLLADVESDELGGPFDFAFSRFGTMFFERPLRAFRNIRRSLSPGGTLCLVVWRRREDSPAMYVAECIARDMVPVVEDPDAVTCGPGPFSMASADVVSDILIRAGFTDIRFERNDALLTLAGSVEDAVDFALELGPAGEILRLAKAEGELLRPAVAAAIGRAFSDAMTPEGVRLGSSTWIVTARAA